MLFKDLKVGDTIYVKNPIYWDKPIKKTIDKIVPFGTRLDFYAENDVFLGAAMAFRSQGIGYAIFADFEAFKRYRIDYHKKNVEQIEVEIKKLTEALKIARLDLEKANSMKE